MGHDGVSSFVVSHSRPRMQLQTILNRVARHSSFVYGTPRWSDEALRPTLEVPIRARANGRPICSGCGRRRPGYDRLQERRFEFVPLWQIAVVFVDALRRVDCPTYRTRPLPSTWQPLRARGHPQVLLRRRKMDRAFGGPFSSNGERPASWRRTSIIS